MVSKVPYDLINASPVTLQQISISTVVVELWRWEINEFESAVFDKFLFELNMLKRLIPDIPSKIKRMIEVYAKKFLFSMRRWVADHYSNVFDFHRKNQTDIFYDFSDFICDWNGAIDYVRTAKRMMICDRLSNDEKFKIACMYCFEDDIRKIWPSVSKNLDLEEIVFYRRPQFSYWIFMLKDELDRLFLSDYDSVDVMMLHKSTLYSWSSIEYFWNRICSENRLVETINLSINYKELFVRFILPKLDEELLNKFLAERVSDLIYALLTSCNDKVYVLPTWMYIKNKINENHFSDLIELLLTIETKHHVAEDDALSENSTDLKNWFNTEDETYLCCEIWRNSPNKLKQSVVGNILTYDHWFVREVIRPAEFRDIRFLLTVLPDASFEERNVFWCKYWRNLINVIRGKDLNRLMKLCFKNEDDIIKFKETTMTKYENIGPYCIEALKLGHFKKLDDFLIFCCPETQKSKKVKKLFLQSYFLSPFSVLNVEHIIQAKSMNEFINDAFDTVELAANFKNVLLSGGAIESILFQCIGLGCYCSCSSDNLISFIHTLISDEDIIMFVKQYVLEFVRKNLINGFVWDISTSNLQTILFWCLGNDDEIAKFKRSLSVDDIFQSTTMLAKQLNLSGEENTNPDFDLFLKWYFDSSEET